MVHALSSLFIESTVVVLFVTCLFWAVTGVVAADHHGRSRVRGALVGGLIPAVGWALLLIPPRSQSSAYSDPSGGYIPPQPASSFLARRRLLRPHPAVTAVGAAAAALTAVAFVAPWLTIGLAVGRDSYAGAESLFTSIPLALGLALLSVAVVMQACRPHGVWCVTGALSASISLLLGVQIWLFTNAVGDLLGHVGSLIHLSEKASAGSGAGCLLGAGLAGLVWSILSLRKTEGL
jgi:hypothetical protein